MFEQEFFTLVKGIMWRIVEVFYQKIKRDLMSLSEFSTIVELKENTKFTLTSLDGLNTVLLRL